MVASLGAVLVLLLAAIVFVLLARKCRQSRGVAKEQAFTDAMANVTKVVDVTSAKGAALDDEVSDASLAADEVEQQRIARKRRSERDDDVDKDELEVSVTPEEKEAI